MVGGSCSSHIVLTMQYLQHSYVIHANCRVTIIIMKLMVAKPYVGRNCNIIQPIKAMLKLANVYLFSYYFIYTRFWNIAISNICNWNCGNL